MMSNTKTPQQTLTNNIIKFTQDMEALYATFPFFMDIMVKIHKQTQNNFQKFIHDNGTKIDETTYNIEIEDIAEYNKLKYASESVEIANKLIPRNFITSLVSQYDSFLGNIIRFIFEVNPDTLKGSEKPLFLKDLLGFANIEEAREYIIEKEVESVIRKSHIEHFTWLKDELKTPFNKDLKSWPIFVELTERRNLFVHCDGVVSSQYIKICSEHKCNTPSVKVGDQLNGDSKYFLEAYTCIYEIGVKMAHVVWRKKLPDDLNDSDENIIKITFRLIEIEQFDLAIRILDFFTQPTIKHASDSNKRTMIINLAQTYKWKKDNEKCKHTIESMDWSATEDRFKLAVAVLQENYDVVYHLMSKLKHDTNFHKTFYKDWPLFQELRKQKQFLVVYEQCYGEQFKLEQQTDNN